MKKIKRPDMRYAKSKNVYHRTNRLDEIVVDTLYDKIKNLQQLYERHLNVACNFVKPLMNILPDKVVDDILNGKYIPNATTFKHPEFPNMVKVGWWIKVDGFELGK